jgi:hypothetical protein
MRVSRWAELSCGVLEPPVHCVSLVPSALLALAACALAFARGASRAA